MSSEPSQQQIDYQSLVNQANAPLAPPISQSGGDGGGGGGEDISHLLAAPHRESRPEYEEPDERYQSKGLLYRYSGFIKSGLLIMALYWLIQQPMFMSYVYKYIPIAYQTGHLFTLILGALLAIMFLVLDELTPNFILNFV